MSQKPLKKKQLQKSAGSPSQNKSTGDPKASRKLKIYLGLIISAFAFLLYAQSIQHHYTLDDHPVIDNNSITTTGLSGIPAIFKTDYWYGSGHDELRGPIYRPTSLLVFATIWQFFPNQPHLYHFINVLFFALTCFLLFNVLCKILKNQNPIFPFICTLLYAAHPIHTEVVNNIKSLDEILCFLFGLLAIYFFLKYLASQSITSLIAGGLSFFMALLSKETGITFLAILPLTIFFFTDTPLKKTGITLLILSAITGVWLLIRMAVFKDLPPNPGIATSVLNNTLNAAPGIISKYATIFYILLRYIGLLIFPHPLSCDYNYPQIKIQTLDDPAAMIGILVYFGLGIYALLNFKKKNIIAFAILFYFITLSPVSNIFFLGGSTMAERFLYIPSLGFCILLTYFLIKITKTDTIKDKMKNLSQFFVLNRRVFFIIPVVILLYSFKTVTRNKDWKDDLTIFSHDVEISKNSATAHFILGSELAKKVLNTTDKKNQTDTLNLAKHYLKRALDLSPDYRTASSYLGYIYLFQNNNDSAYIYLKNGIERAPDDAQLNYYYGTALYNLGRYEDAIPVLNHAVAVNPKNEDAYFKLAASYMTKGDPDNALLSYSKIIALNPNSGPAYYYAGTLLKSKGETAKANEYLAKAASLGYGPK